jgi:hypothetical protein
MWCGSPAFRDARTSIAQPRVLAFSFGTAFPDLDLDAILPTILNALEQLANGLHLVDRERVVLLVRNRDVRPEA